jgi:folylpolyglutamate synthase/dihydropteroate synthase
VSHNLAGVTTTISSIKERYKDKKFLVICSFLDDKDWESILNIFASLTDKIFIYPLNNKRQNKDLLNKKVMEKNLKLFDFNSDFNEIKERHNVDKFLVIGSHYLIEDFLNNYQ